MKRSLTESEAVEEKEHKVCSLMLQVLKPRIRRPTNPSTSRPISLLGVDHGTVSPGLGGNRPGRWGTWGIQAPPKKYQVGDQGQRPCFGGPGLEN